MAVGIALILLLLLIIFMLQNSTNVDVRFLGTDGQIPLGLAMFIAAVGGGAVVAVVAVGRITQLRLRLRRSRRDKVDRD
ncbi:lipopolysaccharide assembly protein LapA domain-containing protein [Nocardioides nitrophenolicus]|uniref:lipopolysaccharide assembly protein LapA domain-containing protein n=1 Tax=Nocardioides nitrophenolicus TaxID=60489 RepID=UPI00195B71DA|nr:lipopolysaccharide assembly protein LapA domain-containing protein [Nocardioides nitrophenolicus]MBM7519196.1 putative integral membrane protein [Nocardioides nitrophenolicus]